MWARRHISLFGKSLVAKTFLFSKLNYIVQSLALPNYVLDTIDDIIFKFLWTTESNKKGREKIKRHTLCLDHSAGGIGMISIKTQQQAFLIKTIHKINNGNKKGVHFQMVNNLFKNLGGIEYFLLCNIDLSSFMGIELVKSYYWRTAMAAWLNLDKTELYTGLENGGPIPIFNNRLITFKNK